MSSELASHLSTRDDYIMRKQEGPLKDILALVTELHSGVPYGKGQMTDQVIRCAMEAEKTKDFDLEVIALLHKSQERSKVNNDKEPLFYIDLVMLLNDKLKDRRTIPNILEALTYLEKEPNDKSEVYKDNRKLYDIAFRTWLTAAPPLVKGILLIEKFINFNESLEVLQSMQSGEDISHIGTKQQDPRWHINYVATRMPVVEIAKDAYPSLYDDIRTVGYKVISLATIIQKGLESAVSGGAGGWAGRVSTATAGPTVGYQGK